MQHLHIISVRLIISISHMVRKNIYFQQTLERTNKMKKSVDICRKTWYYNQAVADTEKYSAQEEMKIKKNEKSSWQNAFDLVK